MSEESEVRSDPGHWRGGWLGIYVNAQDRRLWVPKKRPGIGWTLNLGHPKARWVIAVFLAVAIALLAGSILLDAR
jgi:uncharacterized membrane protein